MRRSLWECLTWHLALNSLVLCTFVPTIGKSASVQETPPPPDPSTWTNNDWKSWRDQQINLILEPTFDYKGEKLLNREEVISRSSNAFAFLSTALKNNPNLLNDPVRAQLLTNFLSFVKAQHWMGLKDQNGNNTHALGLEITDREYWDYTAPHVQFPPLVSSPEFLKNMSDPSTYKAAYEMIQHANSSLPTDRKWVVFPFRAGFIKSVDKTTYGRMLILIPKEPTAEGATVDKWILFSIATPDLTPAPQVKSVSIFAVERAAGAGKKTKTYFADFMREQDPTTHQISINSTFLMNPTPSKNCYDCHKSAVLPIYPALEYEFSANGGLAGKTTGVGEVPRAVNLLIRSYGPADFGVQQTEAYGPSLGQEDLPRSDEFIRSACQDLQLSPTSYDKIRDAMNCATCHDQFAKINYLQAVRSNRDAKAFLGERGMVQTYIEEGIMPRNNSLTQIERSALWRCLMKEYFDPGNHTGTFVSWLKGENIDPSLTAESGYVGIAGLHNPLPAQPRKAVDAALVAGKHSKRSSDEYRPQPQDLPVHGF